MVVDLRPGEVGLRQRSTFGSFIDAIGGGGGAKNQQSTFFFTYQIFQFAFVP